MAWTVELVRAWKQDLVADGGIGASVPSMVVTGAGGTVVAVSLPPGRPELEGALGAVVAAGDGGVHFVFEGFVQLFPALDGPSVSLADRFAAGDPSVLECVNVLAYGADGSVDRRLLAFRVEGGRVVWEDVVLPDVDIGTGGPFHDVIVDGFAARAAAVASLPALRDVVRGFAGQVLVFGPWASSDPVPPTARRSGRNEVCWCGSGDKTKRCHPI